MRCKACCALSNEAVRAVRRRPVFPMTIGAAPRCCLALLLCCTGARGADAGSVTVYAAGDIADCRYSRAQYAGAARTAALLDAGMEQDPGSALLTLGDHTYPHGLAAEFRDCYAPTWGRYRDRTYPSPGNHEYLGGKADGYYDYFGNAAGPRGRGYYSFDLGAWHLVSLNSQVRGAESDAQLAWLKEDLARHARRCTLAYWHAPLYSSGGHGGDARMRAAWQLLYQAGADLVLSGHDHGYERFAPQDADGRRDDAGGLRQFVVGTGGAYLTPFRWTEAHSAARDNRRHGVLKLVLGAGSYSWEFLAADAAGPAPDFPEPQENDSGSARCHSY
ncbi:MAG: metallophosphoesterase [Pseudomonadota bacterium]